MPELSSITVTGARSDISKAGISGVAVKGGSTGSAKFGKELGLLMDVLLPLFFRNQIEVEVYSNAYVRAPNVKGASTIPDNSEVHWYDYNTNLS